MGVSMKCFAVSSGRTVSRLLVVALALAPIGAARAQDAAADPILANVDGQPIRMSDVRDAMENLPQNARSMPPQTLFPLLLDQMIDARALASEARKQGMDKDPTVQRQMRSAEARVLETAMLHKEIDPLITDAALRARYDRDVAGKVGEEELHARHILVPDEAVARKIVADLKKGGDFVALSKQHSKDPGAAQQGGDLGFFKKDDMVPEFATAAFKLKDGEVTAEPVRTQFGWHVIQAIERKRAAPPDFDQARDDIRQKIIQEGVQSAVARARVGVKVERFNLDGSRPRATDLAEPPPAK